MRNHAMMSNTLEAHTLPVNRTETPLILHTRVVTGTGGGPEKTILNSPRFLESQGYRAICAFMHPPEDPGFAELQRRGAAAGARVVSIPDRGPFDVSVVKQFVRLCQKENVTIWHAHDYKSNVMGLLVNRSYPMHLVTTVSWLGPKHLASAALLQN